MPLFPWDAPANQVYRNLPSDTTFRLWVYQKALVVGYNQLAKTINKERQSRSRPLSPVSASALRAATERIKNGYELRNCPRCGNPTPSKHYCAACQNEQREGKLSPREWQNLRDHYATAHEQYGQWREAEHQYREDEYTK